MKCKHCEKEFDNSLSLDQHTKAKHETNNSQQSEPIPVKKPRVKKKVWWILGLIIVILVSYYAFHSTSSNYLPLAKTDHVEGNASAKVTILEFGDFQCPGCKAFWETRLGDIRELYVKTGKAKLIFKHFPIPGHQFEEKAAEASECASDQGKFWEYHDKLYSSQALDINSLRKYAKDLNLNETSFNACLDSGVMFTRISSDAQLGQSMGARGTPSFYINNEYIFGVKPLEVYKTAIEKGL